MTQTTGVLFDPLLVENFLACDQSWARTDWPHHCFINESHHEHSDAIWQAGICSACAQSPALHMSRCCCRPRLAQICPSVRLVVDKSACPSLSAALDTCEIHTHTLFACAESCRGCKFPSSANAIDFLKGRVAKARGKKKPHPALMPKQCPGSRVGLDRAFNTVDAISIARNDGGY
jgi:hypothetical protein